MIKLVNFIRGEGKAVGRWPPDLSSKNAFQSEHWLKPQLEDDALLYSLHDIIGENLEDDISGVPIRASPIEVAQPRQLNYHLSTDPRPDNPKYRIAESEMRVRMAQIDLERHEQLLAEDMQLHAWLGHDITREPPASEVRDSPRQTDAFRTENKPQGNVSKVNGDADSSYFASYSGHGKLLSDLARWPNVDVGRHPRNHVERHSPNRRLQRFHI